MKIAIYGAGGAARDILQIVLALQATGSPAECIGFLVDPEFPGAGTTLHGLPVLGDHTWLRTRKDVGVTVAIGSPAARRRLVRLLESEGSPNFPVLRHPGAGVGEHVEIGAGSIIYAGVQITTDIKIGRHVHLNLNCSLSHDVVIGDFATLAPGVNLPGRVSLGEGVDLGTAASAIPGVRIGAWSIAGAGAVITQDVPPGATVVGVPAKVIKQRVVDG